MKSTTIKKRKIPVLHYVVRSVQEYQQITDMPEVRRNVFGNTLDAIVHGLLNNIDDVDIFQIQGSVNYVSLNKSSWKGSLISAMHFFAGEEDYKRAAVCRDLIAKL